MLVDDDYDRKHSILQHSAAPTAAGHATDQSRPTTNASNVDRTTSPATERLEPPERFQTFSGASERYPIGTTPVDRLVANYPTERYQTRYVPDSLDRYGHGHVAVERYSRTTTPTDRYHGERCSSGGGGSAELYEGFPVQQMGSLGRHTPTGHRIDFYHQSQEAQYKRRDRSRSTERKTDAFHGDAYRYDGSERFLAIPCPDGFATQERTERPERITFCQTTYMAPPSPAPASDRFIPPPPLSPSTTPSPDCYASNTFPSPTNSVPPPERFAPPPPLAPSPTDTFSPKQHRYGTAPGAAHYKDRSYLEYHYVNAPDRYTRPSQPPNPHTPVERYTPQQQDYYQYPYPKFAAASVNINDPYMRRDLFQYRVAVPFQPPYQRVRYIATTPNRKCCQYQECYQLCRSSPCSSSSSSVTSQGKELIKEEVQCFQQEKGVQCGAFGKKETCGAGYVSPSVRPIKGQCRHSMCATSTVEYVGQSGGRHVCATPPPRGSICSMDGAVCTEQCCPRRTPNSMPVSVWRSTSTPQPPQQAQQPQLPQQQQSPVHPSTSTKDSPSDQTEPTQPESEDEIQKSQIQPTQNQLVPQITAAVSKPSSPAHQRVVSLPSQSPETNNKNRTTERRLEHSQSERLPERPKLSRSMSRKDAIKDFIKKETANFFGVDEENQEDQQMRWLDRRKRLAERRYGPLKEEYQLPPSGRTLRRTVSEVPAAQYRERPDVLPGDIPDGVETRWPTTSLRRKDSVARMTWDGLSYVVTTLTRHRPRQRSQQAQWSRSFPPEPPVDYDGADNEVFYEQPPTSQAPPLEAAPDSRDAPALEPLEPSSRYTVGAGWRRSRGEQGRREVGGSRIFNPLLDGVLDNSNRRQYGMGWAGRMFGRSMRTSFTQDDDIKQQLDDMEDHRPMFTYWVTIVQILVLFISLVCYGFGPFGVNLQGRSSQVLMPNLATQQVDYWEPAHFWLGPRAGDLIHLGAKFAPCMRVDDKIQQQIEKMRANERNTACCIRNDDSGCVQSSRDDCSKTISTWKKWTRRDAGPGGRISGSVCGLDPKYCGAPASVHPYEWPDDITKWPICRKTNMQQFSIQNTGPKDKSAEHMICEVIGHPCCIGIHGLCKIATREYCDFVRGHFHEEASLCSQVSCLDDVCGMVPFYFAEAPDQFYRLGTSLFLHAGILQLLVTLFIQHYLMRDLEKLTGSLRIAIIYLGSGIAGNLASAIFVPYRADVGPSGSHFGLLACLIVEVLNAWPMLKHPNQALCKLLSITLFLFLIGLLPWVDNYAHLFGFAFGFLLSYALLPFISFGPYDRHKKIVLIWVCLLSAGFLFVCLVLLFYIIPVYDCEICSYLNCIPLSRDFCATQNINFKREDALV